VLLALAPAALAGQTSQFGVRGLGLPVNPISARARAMGGVGIFDPEGAVNPAAVVLVPRLTAFFQALPERRTVENPAGTATVKNSRYPLMGVYGPIRRYPIVLGITFSSYATRDFTLASVDTVTIQGQPVEVFDTLSSRGGMGDIRFVAAYQVATNWAVGGALHFLTGSNRESLAHTYGDTNYSRSTRSSEISAAGVGFSAGVIRRLGSRLNVAAVVRSDGHANYDRDSLRVGTIDLPYTFAGGLQYRPSQHVTLAGQATYRTWSGANSDLLRLGGTGAANTLELNFGAELLSDPRRPSYRPLRFGAWYADLPFPLVTGEKPREYGVSVGSGIRFAQQRGGLDLALARVWRSEGSAYKERAWLLTLGASVRPY
jgi:hypothetical protein